LNIGLSIVICTYNGVNRLYTVLEYINNLFIPSGLDYEVLIVDNASTDGTKDWIDKTRISSNWKFKLSVISESKPGLNFARLTGARNACFDWILFCDDDNLLDSQYVQFWHHTIQKFSDVGAIGGQGIPNFDIPVPSWFNRYSHSYAVGPQHKTMGYLKHGGSLYGAGMFILKTPVLELLDSGFKMVMSDRNGGKLSSGGDLEWCYLLQLSGWKLYYNEKMTFHHQISSSRLLWSYYLKLKSGIASGAGLLFAYQFMFKYGKKCIHIFLLNYLFHAIKALLVYIYASIKLNLFFKTSLNNDNELALAILKSKALSFFYNFIGANMHYKNIKKFFSASF
jgi:glycosyltransferase involved in cell wall biosynthesis